MIQRHSRKKIYRGYCFEVVRDEVTWPNRLRLKRDLIIHPGISVMIPLLDKNHVVLVRQFRYGANQMLWEIPAGTIDGKERPLSCAKRELAEEIGYSAKKWKKIARFYSSPGFNTKIVHCFLATHLVPRKSSLEADEILRAKVFSVGEVERMIRDRKIRDAKSLVPLFYFLTEHGRSNGR